MSRSRPVVKLLVAVTLLAGCASLTTPARTEPSAMPVVPTEASDTAGPELLAGNPPTRPDQPPMSARISAVLVADHCMDRDLPAPPVTDPVLAVLDRSYALSRDDVPPDLVQASAAGLEGVSGTKLVREIMAADLADMRAAWQAAGLTIVVDSAYRTYEEQAATFDGWAARIGQSAAMVRTARPGHSEHQLGTAIDVTSPGWSGRFGDWAVEAAEGAWMAEHAWEYGFVMSYPADGLDVTCYGYEPWHYRWVGRDVAAEHRRSGLHLRRFLERYAGA